MANERITDLFIMTKLEEAGITAIPDIREDKFIYDALKTASKKGTGRRGHPDVIARSGKHILVFENKASRDHQALYEDDDKLAEDEYAAAHYAENGAVYYGRKLKDSLKDHSIIAFGCSGNKKSYFIRPVYMLTSGYKLLDPVKDFSSFSEGNIEEYIKVHVYGEKPQKLLEMDEILKKAAELHEALRNYGQLGDAEKPLVVSAILLALCDVSFDIRSLTGDSIKTDGQKIFDALCTHMERLDVKPEAKKKLILNQFTMIKDRLLLNRIDERLKKTPLKYFAEFLNKNILKMASLNSPVDVLGRFYGEFIRYSGGDGKSLGVVLTPRHIAELFCDLAQIRYTDKVLDPCCGTGGFLIAAMHHMMKQTDVPEQHDRIKKERLCGIEIRESMFSIAATNMMLRGEGAGNLWCDDFLKIPAEEMRKHHYNAGFMNPPYSQAKSSDTMHLAEICFIKHLLDCLDDDGRCVVIVPQSAMVGKTAEEKKVKRQILENHTLEGVITLNPDTFYRIGTAPCIAVFTAHRPHPEGKYCRFVNFEDDGFVINKNAGLIETGESEEKRRALHECWHLDKPADSSFMVRTPVDPEDEWLHAFYYFNDRIPEQEDFEKVMADYMSFEFDMITHGRGYLFEEDT